MFVERHGYEKQIRMHIAHARKLDGLSQAEIGRRLKVSASYVAQVENGDRGLSRSQFVRFAFALNRQIGWFLGMGGQGSKLRHKGMRYPE